MLRASVYSDPFWNRCLVWNSWFWFHSILYKFDHLFQYFVVPPGVSPFSKNYLAGVQGEIPSEEASTLQIESVAFSPVHNPILVTDNLTKMGIKTVPQPPYRPDLAHSDFCLFPKLRGCRYETIEEMKEGVTKVIDTPTHEDFSGAFQKLLEQYNKFIAAGGDYFEGDYFFMCVLSIKVPIRKKSGNLSYSPCIYRRPHTDCFVASQLFSVG